MQIPGFDNLKQYAVFMLKLFAELAIFVYITITLLISGSYDLFMGFLLITGVIGFGAVMEVIYSLLKKVVSRAKNGVSKTE